MKAFVHVIAFSWKNSVRKGKRQTVTSRKRGGGVSAEDCSAENHLQKMDVGIPHTYELFPCHKLRVFLSLIALGWQSGNHTWFLTLFRMSTVASGCQNAEYIFWKVASGFCLLQHLCGTLNLTLDSQRDGSLIRNAKLSFFFVVSSPPEYDDAIYKDS